MRARGRRCGVVRKFCVCVDLCHLSTYVPEKLHQYRVREVRPAWQVPVARAAVRVGRVRQVRERALEVEEKDAMPFRVEAGETCPHGPAPLRVVGADVAGLRVFDRSSPATGPLSLSMAKALLLSTSGS